MLEHMGMMGAVLYYNTFVNHNNVYFTNNCLTVLHMGGGGVAYPSFHKKNLFICSNAKVVGVNCQMLWTNPDKVTQLLYLWHSLS